MTQVETIPELTNINTIIVFDNENLFQWNWIFWLNCGHWKKFVLDFNVFNRFYHIIWNLEIVSEYEKSKEMNEKNKTVENRVEPLAKLVRSINNWRLVCECISFWSQFVQLFFECSVIQNTRFDRMMMINVDSLRNYFQTLDRNCNNPNEWFHRNAWKPKI